MEWVDEGVILAVRKHGETSAIVTLLTRAHGRHAGLVRGGTGRAARGVLQPGNGVAARWRGRLAEHLGSLSCELTLAHAATALDDPGRLAALTAACAVAEAALPERESCEPIYEGLLALLAAIDGDVWPTAYVRWELGLLAELGFGLDLGECAVTGSNDQLAYVSPRSGRAVSLAAGEPYKDRLLALPPFLAGGGNGVATAEVADGLRLTGYFLERHVFAQAGRPVPAARQRLEERLRRQGRGPEGEAISP